MGVAPGDYAISEAALQADLRAHVQSRNADNLVVRITPAGVAIGVTSNGQDTTYTGMPAAEDGRLVMRDMDVNSGVFNFFLPASKLGEAIEDGVNTYLAQRHLRLDALQLGDGTLTLHVAATT